MKKILTILLIFISFITWGQTHIPTPFLRNALVMFLKMESSNPQDETKNSNDATDVNSPTYGSGKVGNAVTYNGSTQYSSIPSDISFYDTQATYMMWIKLTTASLEQLFLSWSSTTDNFPLMNLRIRSSTNKLAANYRGDDDTVDPYIFYEGSTTFTTGTWYHVAVTWVKSTLEFELYVNGSAETITDLSTGTPNATATFTDGTLGVLKRATISNYFDGSVDEVKIYNRVLSATEIKADYASGDGLKYVEENFKNDNNYENLINYTHGDMYFAWTESAD